MRGLIRWKTLTAVIVCVLGIFYALPNVLEDRTLSTLPDWFPHQRVSQGLDLQGGSHILLGVDLDAVVEERLLTLTDMMRRALREEKIYVRALRSNQKDQVTFTLKNPEDRDRALVVLNNLHTGGVVEIDPAGQGKLLLTEPILQDLKQSALNQSREIVEKRIDETGTREPTIQINGTDRIIVQLPGVDDPTEIKDLLGQTARLSFHEVIDFITVTEGREPTPPEGAVIYEHIDTDRQGEGYAPLKGYVVHRNLGIGGRAGQDFEVVPSLKEGEIAFRPHEIYMALFEALVQQYGREKLIVTLDGQILGEVPQDNGGTITLKVPTDKVYMAENVLKEGGVLGIFPVERQVHIKNHKVPTVKEGEEVLWQPFGKVSQGPRRYTGVIVKKAPVVRGEMLVNAQQVFGENNQPSVAMSLDSLGGDRYWEFTRKNVGRPVAIVLDEKVISAPVIQQPLRTNSNITGNFTVQKAQELAMLLRSGALPAPITVLEERTVGPDLGADSVAAGKQATIWSIIAVGIFMVLFYRIFGLIANIALVFNLILLLASLSVLGATLTLPGIAGIALTMGMAVDANVLIFERIKEELRQGRAMYPAIDIGFSKAQATIVDSNVTTLIGAVLLYEFGTGPVRGFGVTLMLGILISMFTAVTLTRLLVEAWVKFRKPKTLSI